MYRASLNKTQEACRDLNPRSMCPNSNQTSFGAGALKPDTPEIHHRGFSSRRSESWSTQSAGTFAWSDGCAEGCRAKQLACELQEGMLSRPSFSYFWTLAHRSDRHHKQIRSLCFRPYLDLLLRDAAVVFLLTGHQLGKDNAVAVL